MSSEATAWTWKNSPYTGSALLVHLAIADVVNDLHGNEFWMAGATLAKKAKVSRSTVTTTLRDMLDRGLMELLQSGAEQRKPSRFLFRMPSAVSALAPETRALLASTSAEPASEHARPARAIPKEITQEPKQDFSQCLQCHGSGSFWDGQKDRPCDHTTLLAAGEASMPPWTAAGISRDEWMHQHPDEKETS